MKRLIDLDDDLLGAARKALGTTDVSETVNAALRHVVVASARKRQITWLCGGGLAEFGDPHVRAEVWH